MLILHTQEAETVFALLTQQRDAVPTSPLAIARHWNFHNTPVAVDNGYIQIQDLSGLGSMFHVELVVFLMTRLGVSIEHAKALSRDLNAVVSLSGELPGYLHQYIQTDKPVLTRNTPIQQVEELLFYPGISAEQLNKALPLLTTFPISRYNYLTMPADIMAFYVKEPVLTAVLQARHAGTLTAQTFRALTGLQEDDIAGFSIGLGQRLRFTAEIKGVKIRRQLDLSLSPYAAEPFSYWEYHKYRHVE